MIHLDTEGFLVEIKECEIFIHNQKGLSYYRIDKYFTDLKLKEIVIDNYIYFDLVFKSTGNKFDLLIIKNRNFIGTKILEIIF